MKINTFAPLYHSKEIRTKCFDILTIKIEKEVTNPENVIIRCLKMKKLHLKKLKIVVTILREFKARFFSAISVLTVVLKKKSIFEQKKEVNRKF